jgi:hypothetical protein
MVVPFGSALERRSRTTYRPTVTPEESTHVDTFTGTTSSSSRTASAKVAAAAVARQPIFDTAPHADGGQLLYPLGGVVGSAAFTWSATGVGADGAAVLGEAASAPPWIGR